MKRYLFALLLMAPLLATAQGLLPVPQGRQPIRDFHREQWFGLSSQNIDVQYHGNQRLLAEQTLRMARKAYYELSYYLGYSLRQRLLLQVYAGRGAYSQYAAAPQPYLPSKNHVNLEAVYFDGTHDGYYAQVRAAVAHAMLGEMYYGGGGQVAFQNRILLYMPEWYLTGLTAYLGEGWTIEDEMVMRSLDKDKLDQYILNQRNGRSERTIKKSIWHFIERKFGRKKIAEVAYMVRLARSVEGGTQAVLGMGMKRLTDQWIMDAQVRYQPEAGNTPAALAQLPGTDKAELAGLTVNSTTGEMAYLLAVNGRYSLHYYQPATGQHRKGSYHHGTYTLHPAYQAAWLPMAWNSMTGQLALCLPANGHSLLVYIDGNRHTEHHIQPLLDDIYDLSYSPDGKRLALSGLKNGQVDLYLTPSGTYSPTAITQDVYDDRMPVWGTDGKSLYFSSNRGRELEKAATAKATTLALNQPLNLYKIADVAQWDYTEPIQLVSTYQEYPVLADNQGLYLTSEYSGLLNLAYYSWEDQSLRYLTDHRVGYRYLWQAQGKWYGITWQEGKPWLAPLPPFDSKTALKPVRNPESLHWEVEKTRTEKLRQQQEEKELAAKNAAKADSLKNVKPTPGDTTRKPSIRYYVFDEEEPKKDDRRVTVFGRRRDIPKVDRLPPELFDADTVALGGPMRTGLGLLMRGVNMDVRIDPYANLGLDFRLLLEDVHQHHRILTGFVPYVDLRSTDAYVYYDYLQYRLQPYARLTRQSRYFETPRQVVMENMSGELGLRYPIREDLSLAVGGTYTQLRRRDLDLLDYTSIDAKETLYSANISLYMDHTQYTGHLTLRGTRASFSARYYQSAGSGHITNSLEGHVSHYRMLLGVFNLATRLSAGASLGPQQQTYMMGGLQNWIMSFDFENRSDIPLSQDLHQYYLNQFVTPLHALPYNARNGYQYVMANAELRIPLTRLTTSGLYSSPLYNVQAVIFYDVGTTWRTGNPLSQKNPIDASIITRGPIKATVKNLRSPFVQSFGLGLRTLVVGYFTGFELGWPVEDGLVGTPQFSVSLGKEF